LTEHVLGRTRFVLMPVETIGEAYKHGWRVHARCGQGKYAGMKAIALCTHNEELDLRTLVWTRGAAFPVSLLASRMKCPACGSSRVFLSFTVPGQPARKKVG
jgi:hypothetical protein